MFGGPGVQDLGNMGLQEVPLDSDIADMCRMTGNMNMMPLRWKELQWKKGLLSLRL